MSQHDQRTDTTPAPAATETAAPNTIYRDVAVGASTQTQALGAVDTALGQRGSGEAHASGATFHNDAAAHGASAALGAKAFTAGSDVYFGAGQYQPGTASGDTLIRHELTHVQQSSGVAAPTPGNFRVSSPGDAAETAATARASGAAAGGETAAAHTIYRDPLPGTPTPAPTPGPTPGPTPTPTGTPTPAGPGAGAAPDPYEEFKRAIDASDAATAKAKWALVTTKNKLATESHDFKWKMAYVLHEEAAVMIHEGGLDITEFVYRIFNDPRFDQWLGALRANNLLTGFLNADPKKGVVTADMAQKLKGWVNAATSAPEATTIFEKVYPHLNTTAYAGEVAAPWTQPTIAKLYGILATQLPVGHVQTVTGGFTLMRQHTQNGKLVTTNFAWWNPDIFRVVLNESSSGPGEGGTGHDMTGGGGSGASSAYTKPDGTAGTQTTQTHFQGSALHEVGHGVGARMGGDAYAENTGSYPGWTSVGRGSWINGMWTGSAGPNGTKPTGLHSDADLSAGDAKDFLATEIAEGAGKYSAGWFNDAPRADIARYVNWKFGNEPLGKYWNAVVNGGLGADNAYSVSDPARIRGDWTYGYLTRFHGSPWAKFKTVAYNNKVSWYGISSPKEWWAEQYAHYYRTEKTGGGLIDATTKKLLDDLDKKQFLPTNASGTQGISFGSDAQVAMAQPGNALRREPAMFPW
jgi:hypothetical protein